MLDFDTILQIFDFVTDVGLDVLDRLNEEDDKEQIVVNLQPVVDAIEDLGARTSEIADILRRPAETAGAEHCQHAALALSQLWYDDALKEAEASIAAYRFRATPHLIAAVSSLALNNGHEAMVHFENAVKYSANGEQDVGSVAALMAARLSLAIGAPKYALRLLKRSDEISQRSCPAVACAIAELTDDDKDPEGEAETEATMRFIALYWADCGQKLAQSMTRGGTLRWTALKTFVNGTLACAPNSQKCSAAISFPELFKSKDFRTAYFTSYVNSIES
ncbi:hypothetical protein [Sinomonas gamaensis]|uniref:hypothetical protein n=1 Tax=Sinomonas gamaensis TaxID=2565624 RepID=UPI0011084DFB|nr:hypothetical protein [Sinomonas gamaensis]